MPNLKISDPIRRHGLRLAGCALLIAGLVAAPTFAQSEDDSTPPAIVPPEGEADVFSYGEPSAEDATRRVEAASPSVETARPRIERARLVGKPGHRWNRGTQRVIPGAARAEFSRQGDWIAYDKGNDRGRRALYISLANGDSESCLSCDLWDSRNANILSPTWHPRGQVLVAMVQGAGRKLDLNTQQLASPARGLHSDLWAFTRDGKDAWQITNVVPQGGAILDPVFSQEGDKLAWTERYDTTVGGKWGAWQVRIAEFEIKRGLPRLGKVRTLRLPGPAVAVLHGFTGNDRGLWLSVSRDERVTSMQAARLDLESGRLEWLPPLGDRDDRVLGIPGSERRLLVSNRDIPRPSGALLTQRSDLWFASASGRRQERLSFYNNPDADDHFGETHIADLSWGPRGEGLMLHLITAGRGSVEEGLYLLDLSPELAEGGGALTR
ncbi:MAG: hypothetical protein AAGM22_24100 [Acidobacteriota bacterium]